MRFNTADVNYKIFRKKHEVSEKCKKCAYRGPNEGKWWGCNYSDYTGHCRSLICPVGDKCTEFVPRDGSIRINDTDAISIASALRKQEAIRKGKQEKAAQAATAAMELYKKGLCDREIGELVHRSSTWVAELRSKNKLPPHRDPQINRTKRELHEQIEELYNKGYSDSKISHTISCNRDTVKRWREKRGLASNSKAGVKKKDVEKTEHC